MLHDGSLKVAASGKTYLISQICVPGDLSYPTVLSL